MRTALVQSWRLGALFIAAMATAAAAQDGAGAGGAASSLAAAMVTVREGTPLVVECSLPVDARPQWTVDGRPQWTVDGRPAGDGDGDGQWERGERADGEGRVTATLRTARAGLRHAGRYSCGPRGQPAALTVHVLPRAAAETETAAEVRSGGGGGSSEWDSAEVVWYDVRGNLSLRCGEVGGGGEVVWRKNGTAVGELGELRERLELGEGGRLLRVVPRAREDDWGNWSCSWSGGARYWRVQGRPHARLPSDTGVVEGQRLKLVCRLTGRPYPAVEWRYSNASLGNESLPVEAAMGSRVTLKASDQGVAGAELIVEPAARTDAGRFECVPLGGPGGRGGIVGATTLRVKDMYAALWPFLGIVAEVVVLCCVILVYERRRAPQLDDSDTDNHDQKKS